MKRGRDLDLDTANCLMLLSKVGDTKANVNDKVDDNHFVVIKNETISPGRVFTCKTCNREFPSFQALGGHRASHKKLPKLFSADEALSPAASPPKPKTHECSICGLEFAIGQALGGHMRRHRQQVADHHDQPAVARDRQLSHDHDDDDYKAAAQLVPVLKKSSSSKRICLDLDLDLRLGPPGSHYNDLKLRLMGPTLAGC
ncbi:Zinc finger protein ZAT8 [Morus notabilis]|uniref:Zinc finger protein ZAT8 n=1 Tax=Morus notabilis TaxID=981085 RepID=W9SCA2_9ROSA|nr:zinc finger protein ZAT8 [Morus notabilis]EXC35058.1 Zinc finger protein ZAT8 [Morus notabilis]